MELATQLRAEAETAAAKALGITEQLKGIAEMAETLPANTVASILITMVAGMEVGTPDHTAGIAAIEIINK